MSIVNLILFVSSTSKASGECINILKSNNVPPFNIVRLDTEEARNLAQNGEMFQIQSVPTLVTIYSDGNMQLFTGTPKIVQWFQNFLTAKSQPKNPRPSTNIYDTDPYEMHEREEAPIGIGPLPIPRGISKKKVPNTGYREPLLDEGDEMVDDFYEPPIEIEDDYIEPVYEEIPKVSKKKKKPVKVNPSVAEAKNKINHAVSSKSKPKNSKMKNVYSTAKKMQQEMENSLGYKEEELPHY